MSAAMNPYTEIRWKWVVVGIILATVLPWIAWWLVK